MTTTKSFQTIPDRCSASSGVSMAKIEMSTIDDQKYDCQQKILKRNCTYSLGATLNRFHKGNPRGCVCTRCSAPEDAKDVKVSDMTEIGR